MDGEGNDGNNQPILSDRPYINTIEDSRDESVFDSNDWLISYSYEIDIILI